MDLWIAFKMKGASEKQGQIVFVFENKNMFNNQKPENHFNNIIWEYVLVIFTNFLRIVLKNN